MKVSELIEFLMTVPQDEEVFLAYDSFVCVDSLNKEEIVMVHDGGDRYDKGLYFCSMTPKHIEWCLSDVGAIFTQFGNSTDD